MKLSVVIPVYNAAPYLRDCLDSVRCAVQTVSSSEIICVDDGSTDGSGEILDEYAAGGTAFRVVHQTNAGVSAARNRALEMAQGEWIAFVDADDTVDAAWFARLLAHATEDVDLVHADARFCFEGVGRGGGDGTYRTFLRDGWTVLNLVRKSLVGATRFVVGLRFKEDVVFFTTLGLKTSRIAWVRERGYFYRRHVGSAVEQRIRAADSVRFCEEILKLGLPREDAGRTIGFDLVLWVKGRDWSKGYDSAACPVLAFWRRAVAEGTLRLSDVRGWWRPGLRHWLKTGDLGWLVRTRDWRVRLECWAKGRRVAYPERAEPLPPAELRILSTPSFSERLFRDNGGFVAVVLVYDQAERAGAAVRSALEQDWPCFEVLAMDDASSDGSAEVLRTEVETFLAAHPEKPLRVRYVRNAANRTTLGQWRQAVRLSSGTWFGLFCGDDVARPDRLRVAAELVAAHPRAAALCTNYARMADGRRMRDGAGVQVHDAAFRTWAALETVFGCTAFWHRRVLSLDLPTGTMDDFTLTWLAAIAHAGDLVWDFDRVTVDYSVGTGVTTVDRAAVDDEPIAWLSLYRKYRAIVRRGRRFGRRVWDPIRRFDGLYGRDARLSRQIRGLWVASATEGGGWWTRLAAVWTVLVVDRGNDYGGLRQEIVRKVTGRWASRFFGGLGYATLVWAKGRLGR